MNSSLSASASSPALSAGRDRRLALAALVVGALAIGATPILVRLAECGPAAAGFWRLALALPLLAVLGWRRGDGLVGRPSPAMLTAGVMFALDLACWHYGIRFTSVANATVLPNLTPVLVAVAGWLFLRERVTGVFLVGMFAAAAGAVLMALARPGLAAPGAQPHLGDALCLATAFWYGLYFLAVRRARGARSTLEVMAWTSLVGAPILLIVAVALRENLLPTALGGWAALAGLGLAHVAGQGAIAWALGRLPASTAALVVLVQPLAAATLAWFAFGEGLTLLQGAGGALALAGVAFAQAAGRKAASASA